MPKALALSTGAAAAVVAITIVLTSPQVELHERSRVPLADKPVAPTPVADVPATIACAAEGGSGDCAGAGAGSGVD